jgi:hypothetical protein
MFVIPAADPAGHSFAVELIGSVWFRGAAPVAVSICFELVVRYMGLADSENWKREDGFVALTLCGVAIAALPGLIAVRTAHLQSTNAVATGALTLVALVLVAVWLARFDRRALRKRRRTDGWLGGLVAATLVPNVLAGALLGLVFALAP